MTLRPLQLMFLDVASVFSCLLLQGMFRYHCCPVIAAFYFVFSFTFVFILFTLLMCGVSIGENGLQIAIIV